MSFLTSYRSQISVINECYELFPIILTAIYFITRFCLVSWSIAVLSAVRWRGIGAGSCFNQCSSSTRRSALRTLRPIRIPPVNSCNIKSIASLCMKKKTSNNISVFSINITSKFGRHLMLLLSNFVLIYLLLRFCICNKSLTRS